MGVRWWTGRLLVAWVAGKAEEGRGIRRNGALVPVSTCRRRGRSLEANMLTLHKSDVRVKMPPKLGRGA